MRSVKSTVCIDIDKQLVCAIHWNTYNFCDRQYRLIGWKTGPTGPWRAIFCALDRILDEVRRCRWNEKTPYVQRYRFTIFLFPYKNAIHLDNSTDDLTRQFHLWTHVSQDPIDEFIDACVHSGPILHATRRWSERHNASQIMVWPHTVCGVETHQRTAAVAATRIVALQSAGTQLALSNYYVLQTIHAIASIKGHTVDFHLQFDVAVGRCWRESKLFFLYTMRFDRGD